MTDSTLLLGFPEYHSQARRLANASALPYAEVKIHRFPDGESKITLPAQLPKHIIICRSLNAPNEKLLELFMVAANVRDQGAKTISLISPYLCYMRQDKAFHTGEVISQHVIGNMLASYFDNILTVDAHLHRISQLSQAIPTKKAINLTATEPMAHFIQKNIKQPFLIGPDEESEQWVADIASHYNMDYSVATKQRYGDKNVKVSLPDADYRNRNIILVDDIASTGKTLLAATKELARFSPASVSVLVTHALFIDDALAELERENISNIWSCDTIPHHTNSVFLAAFFAKALEEIF
ncbi:MAG: ribose-phosphate diphosphokinase [Methylophaga sp.]|nr:ribose-phosphate diphosphokinase [Methylophaga sp.]